MCSVRAYVPTTLPDLSGRVRVDGDDRPDDQRAVVVDSGVVAFAVTPALREWYREGDLEELEYVAFTHAARASLRLLAASGANGAKRRVVLAVDLADDGAGGAAGAGAAAAPDADPAAVRLGAAVTLDAVAAVHVDDPSAESDVAAAAQAVAAADAGDADAQFVVDGLDDHELQWYAVQEIATLLG